MCVSFFVCLISFDLLKKGRYQWVKIGPMSNILAIRFRYTEICYTWCDRWYWSSWDGARRKKAKKSHKENYTLIHLCCIAPHLFNSINDRISIQLLQTHTTCSMDWQIQYFTLQLYVCMRLPIHPFSSRIRTTKAEWKFIIIKVVFSSSPNNREFHRTIEQKIKCTFASLLQSASGSFYFFFAGQRQQQRQRRLCEQHTS